MATRSNIGIKLDNGSIEMIYCHWDGYLSYNGKILLEHYNTTEKVNELIKLGNISTLGETTDQCKRYNEQGVIISGQTFIPQTPSDIEYVYLWNGSQWLYAERNFAGLHPLTMDLCQPKD